MSAPSPHYDTDKDPASYEASFLPWKDRPVNLLELGIDKGGSLLLWRDYFAKGKNIVGLDCRPVQVDDPSGRIRVYHGRQEDTALLSRIATDTAPEGFDIIIDDASHLADLTRISFWHLFDRHLKPGGLYVIEDWGTGYWEDWPDGQRYRPRSTWRKLIRESLDRFVLHRPTPSHTHQHGMVGFIKELVDEQGRFDRSRGHTNGPASADSRFESVLVTHYVVFVTKLRGSTG